MPDFIPILHRMEQGDRSAAEDLLPLLYDELRLLAAQKLSHEPAGHRIYIRGTTHLFCLEEHE